MDDPMNFQPSTSDNSKSPFLEQESNSLPPRKKTTEMGHMEAELRLTLEEIARLQNALAESNMKNIALQASIETQPSKIEGAQVLKPVLQELKQPIHTIQGYIDLLSNESVGILGTFQKRFVERISNAVNHLDEILKNLEMESGELDNEDRIYSKNFSLTAVVEETLMLYTELLRTKLITLKVEFEKDNINFTGDQEKLERILNIVYSNCLTAVQEEGIVTLGLKLLQGKKPAQVLISVQSCDHDLPKSKPLPVNMEEFRDLEIKLEGFGSPLKDLVKAKTLVDEMHGKMEIFSIPSSGSLIRVRVPVTS
jgi:signal transduction histidine kinase